MKNNLVFMGMRLLIERAHWARFFCLGDENRQFVGWGYKRSGKNANKASNFFHSKSILLEDGFLRSFGTGQLTQSLSVVMDNLGIYYDCHHSNQLEALLNSDTDVLSGTDYV